MTTAESPRDPRPVFKLLFCLRRRSDLTHEEFLARWRGRHADIALGALERIGAVRYVQNHALAGSMNADLRASRNAPEPYDGVAELWFPSLEAASATFTDAGARRAVRALLDDEPHFIDLADSPIFLTEEHAIWGAGV